MRCWSCKVGVMVEAPTLGIGWYCCSNCGATWVEMLKPAAPAMTLKADPERGKSYSPRKQRKGKVKNG